ncbi:hypothetical protein HOD08_00065, partial [bacterium]|nr:hypothetical protein [bacterium]
MKKIVVLFSIASLAMSSASFAGTEKTAAAPKKNTSKTTEVPEAPEASTCPEDAAPKSSWYPKTDAFFSNDTGKAAWNLGKKATFAAGRNVRDSFGEIKFKDRFNNTKNMFTDLSGTELKNTFGAAKKNIGKVGSGAAASFVLRFTLQYLAAKTKLLSKKEVKKLSGFFEYGLQAGAGALGATLACSNMKANPTSSTTAAGIYQASIAGTLMTVCSVISNTEIKLPVIRGLMIWLGMMIGNVTAQCADKCTKAYIEVRNASEWKGGLELAADKFAAPAEEPQQEAPSDSAPQGVPAEEAA